MPHQPYNYQFLEECLREQLVIFLENSISESDPAATQDLINGLHDYDSLRLPETRKAVDDIHVDLRRLVNNFEDWVKTARRVNA